MFDLSHAYTKVYNFGIILSLLVPIIFAQTNSTQLPAIITSSLPSCSFICIQAYIAQELSPKICPDSTDITCLCAHNSSTGYTLGESALQCVISGCDNQVDAESAAYSICSGQQGALPNTHPTLTATVIQTVTAQRGAYLGVVTEQYTSTSSETFIIGSQTSTAGPIPPVSADFPTTGNSSLPFSEILTATGTPSSLPASITPSMSQTVQPQLVSQTSTTSATCSAKTNSLTDGQIAGIVVGGVASTALSIGFLLILFCLRRRRSNQRNNELDLEIEKSSKPIHDSPYTTSSTTKSPRIEPPGIPGGLAHLGSRNRGNDLPKRPGFVDRGWSFWSNKSNRRFTPSEPLGLAVQGTEGPRIVSKLLPENPNQAPRSIGFPQRHLTTQTDQTWFTDVSSGEKDDEEGSHGTSSCSSVPSANWPLDGRESNWAGRLVNSDTEEQEYAREDAFHTKNRAHYQPEPTIRPYPQQIESKLPKDIRQAISTKTPQLRTSSIYSPRPSNELERSPQISRHPVPHRATWKTSSRHSNASETSFESGLTEPEEQGRQLTPVIESPKSPKSPGGGQGLVQYPRIPRSDSLRWQQRYIRGDVDTRGRSLVTSSTHSRDHSLLAKRRGDEAARDLELGLGNSSDFHRSRWRVAPGTARQEQTPTNEDSLRGATHQKEDPNLPPTPGWVPRLTPTRKGAYLYLDVQ